MGGGWRLAGIEGIGIVVLRHWHSEQLAGARDVVGTDLQLAEAHMIGVGWTPCRSMATGRYAGGSDILLVSGVRRSSGLVTARITLVATCA